MEKERGSREPVHCVGWWDGERLLPLLLQGFWGPRCKISVQTIDAGFEHKGTCGDRREGLPNWWAGHRLSQSVCFLSSHLLPLELEGYKGFFFLLQEEDEFEQQEPLQKRRGDEVNEKGKKVLELKNLVERQQVEQVKERY